MSEKKVEVAIEGVGSETRKNTVSLGYDGVKMRKTLPPACDIRWNWCPRGDLLGRVINAAKERIETV